MKVFQARLNENSLAHWLVRRERNSLAWPPPPNLPTSMLTSPLEVQNPRESRNAQHTTEVSHTGQAHLGWVCTWEWSVLSTLRMSGQKRKARKMTSGGILYLMFPVSPVCQVPEPLLLCSKGWTQLWQQISSKNYKALCISIYKMRG